MGLWDRLTGELIDIIEWLDPTNDTMVHRYERRNNEIKYGAKLVVRESQTAVFIDEGQLADVFPPGTYTLETQNLPILATLKGWKYGFESPFKSEVYFVNTKRFTDQKWGTKNPIMLRDAEFGPVRLRAFGTYAMRVADAGLFLKEVVGTNSTFSAEEITNQLRNLIVARFSDLIGESKIPVLDLAGNYDELGTFISQRIHDDMTAYGLDVSNMLVENISLPEEVEKVLDKRTSMGVIGNLQAYTQFQAANAMEAAAENPGGEASAGIGMGMGFAMANQMAQNFNQNNQASGAAAPPPLPQHGPFFHAAIGGKQTGPLDMTALREQLNAGALTRETLVWTEGMAGWEKAGECSALAALFKAVPPPLPGQ